jgi:hypothetical protein
MQAQRISAWLGIALAVIGAPLKALRVMRQAEPLSSVAYDYIALALIVAGAVLVLRYGRGRLLAAGWGFGVAMFYGSFFYHYENWTAGIGDIRFERTMVIVGGPFLLLNLLGLVLSLMAPKSVEA